MKSVKFSFNVLLLLVSVLVLVLITTQSGVAFTNPTFSDERSEQPVWLRDTADADFAMKAAIGGMKEVEAGKIAKDKASGERVKEFAEMMIRDHSKANEELKALASKKGVTLPDDLPQDKQALIENLQQLSGSAFDKEYINMMIMDHEKTIDLFQKGSTSAKDEEIRDWAKGKLPVLKMHLKSAEDIAKSMAENKQ